MNTQEAPELAPFVPEKQAFGVNNGMLSDATYETAIDHGRTSTSTDGGTGQSDAGSDYTPAMLGVQFGGQYESPFQPSTN